MASNLSDRARVQLQLALLAQFGDQAELQAAEEAARKLGLRSAEILAAKKGESFEMSTGLLLSYAETVLGDCRETEGRSAGKCADLGLSEQALESVREEIARLEASRKRQTA